jgi:hypothetical protein
MCRYVALLALLAAAPAHAGELAPETAESIALGNIRGVIYFTEAADGYRIVTTLADGERGLPVRFESTLAENQRLTISVPGRLGEEGRMVEVSRSTNKIIVSYPQPLPDRVVATEPELSAE